MALGACLVLAPVRSLNAGQLALVGLAGIVVVGYALVLHEQLADQPWLATPHPIWHEAQAALGGPIAPSVSIARNQPWFELGRPLVCMLAIACGFLVGADLGRARQLMKVIAWSGARLCGLRHPGAPLRPDAPPVAREGGLSRLRSPGPSSTAIRRRPISAPAQWCGRSCSGSRYGVRCRADRWSGGRYQRVYRRPMPRKIVVAFAMLFVCLVAMFMTGSRGAVVLSLLALIVAFTAFFRRDLPRRSGLVTALAGGGAVALILLQLMGAGVNARFDVDGVADEGRLETYRVDAAHDCRPSVVRDRAGDFCLRVSGLSKPECLDVGGLGHRPQYAPRDRLRHGRADRSPRRCRLDRRYLPCSSAAHLSAAAVSSCRSRRLPSQASRCCIR